ncbi:MAG TPA: TetR/AcrR family transcriptional regulator [Flavobacteriaceae bacterium]|nr:TetR/AcrR family transcriptional regulator [Flavobacteriaceae bacterium]
MEPKDKITQKAADMFLNHGFKSVTMDEIATEMGISKKTVYEHFATKTKLVEATTLYLYEIISNGIDAIREQNMDPIEEMYEIKKFVMCNLKGEKASPIFQLQRYYPEIFQEIKNRQFEKMQECVAENLQKGIKKGVYRNNMNLGFVARIYYLGMNGIKDLNIFSPSEFSQKEIHEEFLNYHLRGIVTPKGLEKLKEIIIKNSEL